MAVITFPDQYYLGIILSRFSSSEDGMDNLPLGFMTPEGTDSAAQKRKSTVDNWCNSNHRRDSGEPQFKTLDNEPMGGFRLLDNVKRVSRFNSSMKWRIEDPRGFELEISSDNLMEIINTSVIDEGEILDTCLWARQGSDNFLVPVSSELYQTAKSNTEMSKRSISLKDMKPGDTVWLKNGSTGRFLGQLNYIRDTYKRDGTTRHVFDRAYVFDGDCNVMMQKSPKIGNIIPGEALSHEDAIKIANEKKSYNVTKFLEQKGKLTTRTTVLPADLKSIKYRDVLVGKSPIHGYFWVNHPHSFGHRDSRVTLIEPAIWESEHKIVPARLTGWNQYRSEVAISVADIAASEYWVIRTELLCDGEPLDFI